MKMRITFSNPWVLSFRDNKIYDLSNPQNSGELSLIDIMKTMDNRIKLDPDLLKQYSQSE